MIIAVIVLLFLAVTTFFRLYQFYEISGTSMSPTLEEGEMVFMERGPIMPGRGDIVFFRANVNDFVYVKRVVALPGETVEIRNNRVLIDGKVLTEPYVSDREPIPDFGPVLIPEDHVFVLGDNRKESYDSREMGPVPIEFIIGKLADE